MWFAWEMKFDGTYIPVIYHGDKPGKKSDGSPTPKRKGLRELTGDDCNLSLSVLARLYPLTSQTENVTD